MVQAARLALVGALALSGCGTGVGRPIAGQPKAEATPAAPVTKAPDETGKATPTAAPRAGRERSLIAMLDLTSAAVSTRSKPLTEDQVQRAWALWGRINNINERRREALAAHIHSQLQTMTLAQLGDLQAKWAGDPQKLLDFVDASLRSIEGLPDKAVESFLAKMPPTYGGAFVFRIVGV